jgi:dolichyl-phosphate-mannose-protein mannosyltransferase
MSYLGFNDRHHYFPALYFAIILMSYLLDHVFGRLFSKSMHAMLFYGIISVIVGVFYYFSHFAFGFVEQFDGFEGRRWLSSWKF